MYESVRGRLLLKEPSRCVLEAGGVGYSILVPLSTFEKLPHLGEEASLKTHLSIREDDWRLFGFATDEERTLFRACLKVSGVGPVTALALLSGLSARELRAAVRSGDVKSLTQVKGIGKKTAERLVVELKDAFGVEADLPGNGVPTSGPRGDAIQALVALGLDPAEAGARIERVPNAPGMALADLVRQALRGR